jgi:hypothetical protein
MGKSRMMGGQMGAALGNAIGALNDALVQTDPLFKI